MTFEPQDPAYEARVRDSFARQGFMATIGAKLLSIRAGEVVIELPMRRELTQQHGFLQAGVVSGIIDNACGYAALSLTPPETAVLSVEFKINFLAPALGKHFHAVGRVVRPGHNITVCTGELRAFRDGHESVVALMQNTIATLRGRSGLVG